MTGASRFASPTQRKSVMTIDSIGGTTRVVVRKPASVGKPLSCMLGGWYGFRESTCMMVSRLVVSDHRVAVVDLLAGRTRSATEVDHLGVRRGREFDGVEVPWMRLETFRGSIPNDCRRKKIGRARQTSAEIGPGGPSLSAGASEDSSSCCRISDCWIAA